MKKTGIPNKLTARKMIKDSRGEIKVKWYKTSGEQFHTKLMIIEEPSKVIINGGSANMTKRNMRDYTLDTNIRVEAPKDSKLALDVKEYYERLWDEDGNYTIELDNLDDKYWSNRIINGIQDISGFSTY
jgi:HKD family nuclease